MLDRERTEVRFNGEWLGGARLRGDPPADADDHGRADARARRLREAVRDGPADLGLGAAVPADAGVRLGRGRGRRRARRHRPALQPAGRSHGDGGVRPRAAGRAHDAAPALVGRRQDELVGGEQHPAHGARRRSSSARRCASPTSCCPTGGASWRRRSVPAGEPMEREARARAAHRAPLARGRGGTGRRGALHAGRPRGRGARRGARRRRSPTATRCTCRRCSRRRSGSRRARRAG